jgi:hypothetical protein
MPIYNLTMEKIEELKNQQNDKETESEMSEADVKKMIKGNKDFAFVATISLHPFVVIFNIVFVPSSFITGCCVTASILFHIIFPSSSLEGTS